MAYFGHMEPCDQGGCVAYSPFFMAPIKSEIGGKTYAHEYLLLLHCLLPAGILFTKTAYSKAKLRLVLVAKVLRYAVSLFTWTGEVVSRGDARNFRPND